MPKMALWNIVIFIIIAIIIIIAFVINMVMAVEEKAW